MRNNDEVATWENFTVGMADSDRTFIDFTVPVIDNFGDMGFALSLAISLLERHAQLHIRFYSENHDLFQKMLGGKIPNRISYFPLHSWWNAEHSEQRWNFFGLKLKESECVLQKNPKQILNFDYLQVHGDTGPMNPGIKSLHGTKYEFAGLPVTHIVPSPLPEGGGVVISWYNSPINRLDFLKHLGLSSELLQKKWCSIFVYPKTLAKVLEATKRHPDWVFFVSDTKEIHGENMVSLPFLSLEIHTKFLWLCDANIVRGENTLASAMLAGKPFLWDIYREDNGAHLEKMSDFCKFIEGYVDWGKTLKGFLQQEHIEENLNDLLLYRWTGFQKIGQSLKTRDLGEYLKSFLQEKTHNH